MTSGTYGIKRNILARWFRQAKKWYLDEKIQLNCVAMIPEGFREDEKGFIIFCSKPIPEEVIRQIYNVTFSESEKASPEESKK